MKLRELVQETQELVKTSASDVNEGKYGLKEIEENVLQFAYKIGHWILMKIIEKIEEPTVKNVIIVDEQVARYRGNDECGFKDRFGLQVRIQRRRYHINGKGSIYPLDDRLGLTHCHGYSPLMTQIQAYMGGSEAFQLSAKIIQTVLGIPISATAIRNNTLKVGVMMDTQPQKVAKDQVGNCVIVEIDGTMSPQISDNKKKGIDSLKSPTEYKECNIGIISKPGKKKQIAIWTGACYGKRKIFFKYFSEVLEILEASERETIVFIADGAKNNWEFCNEKLIKAVQILDYYHAIEHLASYCDIYASATVGSKSCMESKKDKSNKYQRLKKMMYEGQIDSFLKEIETDISGFKDKTKRELAQKELNYFNNNKNRMLYNEYREKKFPIGSGMVEGRCKLVVGKRFKGNGMRWKKENNQSVLNVRLAILNNTLESLFKPVVKYWKSEVA